MNLVFGNLVGLWALLGIPAVLLIHFLQEQSKRVKVSTLFLLERVAPQSMGGAKLEKLRNSLPLWLQLLAVLVLTWMLCEPRWIREDARQTIVVVLDASVSMSVFKEKTKRVLEQKLKHWSGLAAKTDWHLLQTDVRRGTLYAGNDWKAMLKAYEEWQPLIGVHDLQESLVVARGLLKGAGMVVLVTDQPVENGSDVAMLSAAEMVENVGIAGVKITASDDDRMIWEVMVRNYGKEEANRSWWLEKVDGSKGELRSIQIKGGQMMLLSGELPPGEKRLWFKLDSDHFEWDDDVPMQLPVERKVRVISDLGGGAGDVIHRMLQALPGVVLENAEEGSDGTMRVAELGAGWDDAEADGLLVTGDSEAREDARLDGTLVVAEDHELTKGLNWMGLLSGKPRELALGQTDEPLLWKGDRVLAFLRRVPSQNGRDWKKLVLNWDLGKSNAARHAAVLVMLHRFVDMVRENATEPWAGNFESGQSLNSKITNLKLISHGEEVPYQGKLPYRVGFFEMMRETEQRSSDASGQRAEIWLQGAVRFADSREADFSRCEEFDTTKDRVWENAMKQSEADRWMPIWKLLLLGCLVLSWSGRKG